MGIKFRKSVCDSFNNSRNEDCPIVMNIHNAKNKKLPEDKTYPSTNMCMEKNANNDAINIVSERTGFL